MPSSDIPTAHVTAFNMVSAPAYIGRAIGWGLDGSLDGEEDISIVIMAKSAADLEKVLERLGLKGDMSKTIPAALIHTKSLRVHPVGTITPASPQSRPEGKKPNQDDNDW